MTKMIENKFFEAFKYGGVVSKCIDWMRYTHNLPEVKQRGIENRDEASKEKEERYYKETLPNEIVKETEAFKREVLPRMGEMLDEIEDNIRGSKTDTERDFYLYSLFKPFGESGCNIAGIYNPTAETAQMKQSRRHERAKSVARNFISLTIKQEQAGTVEKCTGFYVGVMMDFADRLDALLRFVFEIDMMRLQRECGIYLKLHRITGSVATYRGSEELSRELIGALPAEPQHHTEHTNPQREEDKTQPKPTRGKGRPQDTFKDKMIDDANGSKLQKIHTKLDGKKGKDAALIILACIEKGLIMRPTYTQVKNEFGDVGSKTGYNRYLNKAWFTKEELEGAKNSLD